MNEELKIKVVVDTSSVKQSVDKAKKKIKEIDDTAEKSSKGTSKVKDTVSKLKETLKNIEMPKSLDDLKNFKAEGLSELNKTLPGLAKGLAGTLAVLTAIAAVVAGLTKNSIAVAKEMRQVATQAHKIGMSSKSFQKWGYILEQVGGEADNLVDFVKTLTSEQANLREGNEDTTKTFQKLGLSVDKVANMGQEELFESTITALSRVEDQVERTALAYKLFGEEDAANLTNLLSLNNAELERLTHNYEILGGYASETLLQRSGELTTATNYLTVAWQGVKNVLAEAVLPAVVAITEWIVKITAVIRMFFATIFNTDMGKSNKGISQAAGAMSNYGAAVNSATNAVQKLKRMTMGFDELNIVSNPNSPASGRGVLNPQNFIPNIPDFESILPSVEDLGLDKYAEFFERNKRAIEDWSTGILTSLGIIMAIVGFATGNIPLAIAGIGITGLGIWVGMGEGGTWERLGEEIKGVFADIGNFFTDTWTSMKEWGAETWASLKQQGKDTWENLKKWGKESWSKVKDTWKDCKMFFAEKWQGIKEVWVEAPEWFQEKWTNIKGKTAELRNNIASSFETAWSKVKESWSGAGAHFRGIWDNVKQTFSPVGEFFREKFSLGWDNIKNAFSNFKNFFSEAYTHLSNVFSPVVGFFKEKFGEAWANIKNIFAPWKEFFTNLWTQVKNIFTNIGGSIGNCVSGAVRGIINGVVSMVQNSINYLINMLNGVIRLINKIPGVNIGSVNSVSIPRMAKGGIATRSTLANIGENGKEAVLPLENNTGWMDVLADKISQRSSAPSKIVLTVDGRALGWATIDNINSITKQTGGLQLTL